MGFTARRLAWPAAAMGVAAILLVLAFLQYRWTTQIGDNERDRMLVQLRTAIGQFRQDFYRDLVTAGAAVQIDPEMLEEHDWTRFIARYEEWLRNPANAELVSNVYVWDLHDRDHKQELKLERQAEKFVSGEFPENVRKTLAAAPWRAAGGTLRRISWTFDPMLPGMVRPLYELAAGQGRRGNARPNGPVPPPSADGAATPPPARLVGVAVIELNANFIVHQLFPALVQRHLNLSGTTYHVSIFPTSDPKHPIFESGPTPAVATEKPDAEISLIESPFVNNRPPGQRARRPGDPPPADPLSQSSVLRRFAMTFPAALIPGRTQWRLAAQHPAGSLKLAVDVTRRTNLLMSFGALVILAGSIMLLFTAMYRTRSLARMQMEFVAGVSHELRTPVSVICSAADNLAEGVVDTKPQVQNYGQMIRGEARRLGTMVEQILLFSAGKQEMAHYNLQPLDVISVIENVLRDTEAGIAAAGMTLERSIDAELPYVIGDAGAISRCFQNLVSNAIKYGASGGWMKVAAQPATGKRGRPEVSISVEDHGPGIESSELRKIFEPFYRGKRAQDSQVPGTGLGLSLARELAAAMRGDIRVESQPGQGSRFILRLPAAEMPTVTEHESVHEPVHTAD